ncbi:PepSY domain-containing protein [Streptomyces sp. LP05-1]|uniref:PepSY domain-containing protein n=1 Tax=Streptomyces pyxinae TaxID=2970734 RepID=A0ABT2C9X3_9ACTN|nr:PepSY domain-containing protein [Streptomyces sp. LP05-1]MCS0634197.1 PepSY domain-containing protein [Streptomyces sp. LP05-1]
MKRKLIVATVATAALLTGGTAAAFAAGSDDGGATTVKPPKVTAEQALKAASAKGTVIGLDLEDNRSWDVDVLKNGKVQEWQVDGTTAKVTPDHDDED